LWGDVMHFARAFYTSKAWRRCAHGYRAAKSGLCERCLARGLIVPGEEVHHKIRLTPEALKDPNISLNWDNLELLCKQCHLEEHNRKRWKVDKLGRVAL